MSQRIWLLLFSAAIGLGAADTAAWKSKQIPEWTLEDAQQVLSDSPWTKTVMPTLSRSSNDGQSGPDNGRRGRWGGGGIGIGYPGGGIGRPGGYPGGGRSRRDGDDGDRTNSQPPDLKIRWESALPVREAELKARDTNAPTLDENHYAIAVYNVPRRMADADSKSLADQLKKQAALKRDGQKDLKPSSVDVIQREDGPVIVYLFPRSKDISPQDRRVEFEARIGRLEFSQSFFLEDMVYQGKLEL